MKTSVTLALQQDSFVAPFAASEFEPGLDWAQKLGVDGVELSIPRPGDIDATGINRLLQARGLAASTLATGLMVADGLTFCDDDPAVRQAATRRICQHIDLACGLTGKPNVTIGLVRGKGGGTAEETAQQHRHIAECLATCGKYAGERGVTLNLEPFNRYESAHLPDSASAAALIDEAGCAASIGVLYDTFHSNIEDADMGETIRRYGGRFSHVHVADSNRRLPGEGHIDFAAVTRALDDAGYQGYVSLEVLNAPSAEHIRLHTGAALARVINR